MRVLFLILFLTGCAVGIQQDKAMHFAAGAITSVFVTEVTGDPVDGVIAAGIAGVGKETTDVINGGEFSLSDVSATILGGLVSLIKWEVKF